MQWNLGLEGLGLLVGMAFVFGVVAQLVLWNRANRWTWLVAAVGAFVVGLWVSEGLFGWATQEELQPNIDGLSFDEVLVAYVVGVVLLVVGRFVLLRGRKPTAQT